MNKFVIDDKMILYSHKNWLLEPKTFRNIIYLVNFNVQNVDWIICWGCGYTPHLATKSLLETFNKIRKP